jgi:hypothetical protein
VRRASLRCAVTVAVVTRYPSSVDVEPDALEPVVNWSRSGPRAIRVSGLSLLGAVIDG